MWSVMFGCWWIMVLWLESVCWCFRYCVGVIGNYDGIGDGWMYYFGKVVVIEIVSYLLWLVGGIGDWWVDVGMCVSVFEWFGDFDCYFYWIEYLVYDFGGWCVVWRFGLRYVVFGCRVGYL